MIVEGLLTTRNADGSPRLAPMGPSPDGLTRWLFRPFPSSVSGQNLLRERAGVFHITDDVNLLARAAVGRLDALPPCRPAESVEGWVIEGAHRAYEVRLVEADATGERMRLVAETAREHAGPPWGGFNRAKNGVLELAVAATRLEWMPHDELERCWKLAEVLVRKTGGPSEREALAFLAGLIRETHPDAGGWDA